MRKTAIAFALLMPMLVGSPALGISALDGTVDRLGRLAGAAHACGDEIYLELSNCAATLVERREGALTETHRGRFMTALETGFDTQTRIRPAQCSSLRETIRRDPAWDDCRAPSDP